MYNINKSGLTKGKLFCLKRDFCDVVRFLNAKSGRVLRFDFFSALISSAERFLRFGSTSSSFPSINNSFNYNQYISHKFRYKNMFDT